MYDVFGMNSYKHYITSNSGLNTPNTPLRLFKLKRLKICQELGKNCTGAATNCNVKSGCRRAKNDRLEMASEKTDPKRLTRPLDAIKYITINYSTNTLKYIPHARRTNVQKSQRAKTKDTNKRVFSSLHTICTK